MFEGPGLRLEVLGCNCRQAPRWRAPLPAPRRRHRIVCVQLASHLALEAIKKTIKKTSVAILLRVESPEWKTAAEHVQYGYPEPTECTKGGWHEALMQWKEEVKTGSETSAIGDKRGRRDTREPRKSLKFAAERRVA